MASKSNARFPYQHWYEGDFWTLRVRHMRWQARQMYRSMLQGGWDLDPPGKIPNDVPTLIRLADCDKATWEEFGAEVLEMFTLSEDGKYYTNDRQQVELRKAREIQRKRVASGSKGGKSKKPSTIEDKQMLSKPQANDSDSSDLLSNHIHIQNHIQNQNHIQSDAEVLPPLALAQKVAAELCLSGPGIIKPIAGAIEYCQKFDHLGADAAVEFLIAESIKAVRRGDTVNGFWFNDRKWQLKKSANGSNGSGATEDATALIEARRRQRAAAVSQ